MKRTVPFDNLKKNQKNLKNSIDFCLGVSYNKHRR